MIGRPDVMDLHPPGSMTSTHTGNPVCCAAALASIDIILNEDLAGNSARMGEMLHSELKAMQKQFPQIGCVDGKGLVAGVACVKPGTKEPDGPLAARIVEQCMEKGVLMFCAGGIRRRHGQDLPAAGDQRRGDAREPRRIPRSCGGGGRLNPTNPQVLVVGGGMITHDQILPSLLHLATAGRDRRRRRCRVNAQATIRGSAAAFPGREFATHSGGGPDLYKAADRAHAAGNIVIVALPDQLHYEAVMTALDHDQHVFA